MVESICRAHSLNFKKKKKKKKEKKSEVQTMQILHSKQIGITSTTNFYPIFFKMDVKEFYLSLISTNYPSPRVLTTEQLQFRGHMICLLSNGNVKTFETHTCFNTLKKKYFFNVYLTLMKHQIHIMNDFLKVQDFAKNAILMTGLIMNFFCNFFCIIGKVFF